MGCFRFVPHLKEVISYRFPETNIIYDEFITGEDGKKRYFVDRRIDVYSFLAEKIRTSGGSGVTQYLCMESSYVWKKVFNMEMNTLKLSGMLDRAVIEKSGVLKNGFTQRTAENRLSACVFAQAGKDR